MSEKYQPSVKNEAVSAKEYPRHPDHNLVAEKILICRAATAERFGSTNVYQAAENLYAALYQPETIDSLIKPNEKYPDRLDSLKKTLSSKSEKIPTKEEFIATVRHAMIKDVDFSKCFPEEAKKQLYAVMEKSETTIIWTDGDVFGVLEYQLPGSYEQILKIGMAKFFNKMRREIAKKREVDHKDVLSILATEGKMKFIPGLIEKFRERGIEKIIIIEDRMKNLSQAIGLMNQGGLGMEIFPVLVNQGQFKNELGGSDEEMLKSICIISNISELTSALETKGVFSKEKKVGTIFDMDGVLSDDDVRKKIQTDAVINALQEKSWI
ncbi:MAG: hypothetical protein WC026_16330 [Hyphomicrobium sp.]|uniref:hypothetical protein n=1 Tax=Hyphomicrobium sp. TaxID=82 RepID=UPI00356A65E5